MNFNPSLSNLNFAIQQKLQENINQKLSPTPLSMTVYEAPKSRSPRSMWYWEEPDTHLTPLYLKMNRVNTKVSFESHKMYEYSRI